MTPRTGAGWARTSTRCWRCARPSSAAGSSCSRTSASTASPCGNCDTCLTPAGVVGRHDRRAEAAVDGLPAAARAQPEVRRRPVDRHPARQEDGQGHAVPARPADRVRHRHRTAARPSGAAWSGSCWRRGCSRSRATTARWCSPTTSAEVLGRRREVMLRREPERRAGRSPARSAGTQGRRRPAGRGSPDLRAAAGLAGRRRQGAGRSGVRRSSTTRRCARSPPTCRPRSPSSAPISGVGENKLAKYGEGVLEALTADD